METYKILAAMLRRNKFTVAEVAADTGASANTIYTVLRRRKADLDVEVRPDGPRSRGGQTKVYEIRPERRAEIMSYLSGLFSDLDAASYVDVFAPEVTSGAVSGSERKASVEMNAPLVKADKVVDATKASIGAPPFRDSREPDLFPAMLAAAEGDLRSIRLFRSAEAMAAMVRVITQKLDATGDLLRDASGAGVKEAKQRLDAARRKLASVKRDLLWHSDLHKREDLIKRVKDSPSYSKIHKARSPNPQVIIGYLKEKDYVVGRVESAFEKAGSTVTVQEWRQWLKTFSRPMRRGKPLLIFAVNADTMKIPENVEIVERVISSKKAVVVNADKDKKRAKRTSGCRYVDDAANKSLDGMLLEMQGGTSGQPVMHYKRVSDLQHAEE